MPPYADFLRFSASAATPRAHFVISFAFIVSRSFHVCQAFRAAKERDEKDGRDRRDARGVRDERLQAFAPATHICSRLSFFMFFTFTAKT